MGFKLTELIILLVIVMIFFGSKRLPELGGALGEAIKNFKKGFGDNATPENPPLQRGAATTQEPRMIDKNIVSTPNTATQPTHATPVEGAPVRTPHT